MCFLRLVSVYFNLFSNFLHKELQTDVCEKDLWHIRVTVFTIAPDNLESVVCCSISRTKRGRCARISTRQGLPVCLLCERTPLSSGLHGEHLSSQPAPNAERSSADVASSLSLRRRRCCFETVGCGHLRLLGNFCDRSAVSRRRPVRYSLIQRGYTSSLPFIYGQTWRRSIQ